MPNRAISKPMRDVIRVLAQAGYNGPQIVEGLESLQNQEQAPFGNEPVPALRTVQKYISEAAGDAWSLSIATPPGEARAVLSVTDWLRGLGAHTGSLMIGPFAPASSANDLVARRRPETNLWQRVTQVISLATPDPGNPFPLSRLSRKQAMRIAHLAAIAPSLVNRPDLLYSLAARYESAEGNEIEPLDAFLAARPWESSARAQRFYKMAVHAVDRGAEAWEGWPLEAAWTLARSESERSGDNTENAGGSDDGTR